MRALSIAPRLEIRPDQLRGRTPGFTRAIWLYSYDRQVTVDRSRRLVSVETRRFWIWRRQRVLAFADIDRIILRAQALPGFGWWSFLTLGMSPTVSSAFVLVTLGLSGGKDEFVLFTIWETAVDGAAWFDGLVPDPAPADEANDDPAGAVVRLLQEYLRVPVASH